MAPQGITLAKLLESRDNRMALQRKLLAAHPDLALMVFTVVMPGEVKRNPESKVIAEAGMAAIDAVFAPYVRESFTKDLNTGFEGWFLLDMASEDAKRAACDIEDSHPLGRLMDIDVIGSDLQPLSRAMIGKQGRRCLLCDREARFCMRQHTHSKEEIQVKIKALVQEYGK